jgi:exodeoxyribonuclease VII small subunit
MNKEETKKEVTFEESLARLEIVVKEMESGRLTLDEMLTRFEEGSALVKTCTDKLDAVERKIEALIKKGDDVTTAPFDAEPPGDA